MVEELAAAELLRRIRSNDRAFVVELKRIIERIAQKWNWTDRETTDDIVQECFLKIIRNLERGRFQGTSSFMTYVYTIARRTCIDFYRAARAAEFTDADHVTLIDPALSQEDILITREQRQMACRVLLSLPKECRRLWRAVFFGRRNYRQAADLLGFKEGTVKRKMWECRQMARQKVREYEKREPQAVVPTKDWANEP